MIFINNLIEFSACNLRKEQSLKIDSEIMFIHRYLKMNPMQYSKRYYNVIFTNLNPTTRSVCEVFRKK
jgi:hypothetical protein